MRTLQEIKDSIERRISTSSVKPLGLEEALEIIKMSVEDVIKFSGVSGKNSLITSQQLINLLHEVVKSTLIKEGVNPKIDTSTNWAS